MRVVDCTDNEKREPTEDEKCTKDVVNASVVFETVYDLAHFWGDKKVIKERIIFLVLEIVKIGIQKCVWSDQGYCGF